MIFSNSAYSSNVVPFERPASASYHDQADTQSNTHWSREVMPRLEELVRLEHGWDGYRASPIRFENAVFTLSMLERACGPDTPPPDIVPGGSGDLQVEWHTKAGDIELHVLRPNMVHAWWAVAGDDVGEERVLTNDFSDIVAWIRDITETLVVTTTAAA